MAYESDVDKFINILAQNRLNFLTAAGELLKRNARLLCPVGQLYGGNLRQDIDYIVIEKFDGVQYGNKLEYAIYVNKGTGIFAADGDGRQTPWVYFDPKSNEYYRTEGQKPVPYIENAGVESSGDIKRLAFEILGDVSGLG